ncbi:MAG: indolepyruvate oxidoreductase subunit B [Rhizobiales bacterium 65-9]|nr:indolepyruvate oxidoreductase subunit beta family protein [Hyphomicrobiales bacterium]OJY35747.1 MAG: indolepyruvate oxidoreductase subunit B [Rhizobiales bacterium 65-9]
MSRAGWDALDRPLSIAVLAMGGQGGGVLTDWIVAAAEHAGWVAQSTSVPGVAQRTGATIYYVEMLPPRDGRHPVLSLMPTPGDVDVVAAAEFMEAGRAMLRGLVTPDRTTLIASTHRSLAVSEKEKPGDGVAPSEPVFEASDFAARRAIQFDMQKLAEDNGSVISAVMFGALAGAGVLPFARETFEAAIRAGGKGVEPSLRAFAAGFDRASRRAEPAPAAAAEPSQPPVPTSVGAPPLDRLLARIHGEFPEIVRPMLFAGVKRLVDYQDVAYAGEYLDRMRAMLALDQRCGGEASSYALTNAAAKYLAVAMAYDDVIRVADLKTRASRFARVDKEIGRRPDQLVYLTEFMHPRMEEVVGAMPAGLGLWLERQPRLFRLLDRLVNRGRRVKTAHIGWFVSLNLVAALRPVRRRLLRHMREWEHIEAWLALATRVAGQDYPLAVEVLACRRLVKGYSDTHARGQSKFDRVVSAAPGLIGKPDSAGWLRRLRAAALADEEGDALAGALKTLEHAFDP